jgi:hypothetical protein
VQEVNVLRHNNVTNQGKLATSTNLARNFDQKVSRANGFQRRQTAVTTEGNEMKMSVPVPALRSYGHRKIPTLQ